MTKKDFSERFQESEPVNARLKIGGWLIGLVFIAIFYGIINLVIVGGQKLYHHKDAVNLEALQKTMNQEEARINQYEKKNRNNSHGDREYSEYSRLIDTYNSQVKEANELSNKVGSTWYIVPIPGRGHAK